MGILRRITALVGVLALVLGRLVAPAGGIVGMAECVAVGLLVSNEIASRVYARVDEGRMARIVNVQIALDIFALTVLLHLGGGITSPGIVLFIPPFFVYGAILPLGKSFAHVWATMSALAVLAVAEYTGALTHYDTGFYPPDMYLRADFLTLTILFVSVIIALCASMSHYLRVLLHAQEERASALAAERGELLQQNEREAERVRALLEMAQHVSATHTIDELLNAICDTAVTLARVPRVEVFLWDEEAGRLRLAASRGLADEVDDQQDDRQYQADVPIVARLRAGEVVDLDVAPRRTFGKNRMELPFQRGFAAPLVCRGVFLGALFVGCDEQHPEGYLELVLGIARQAALALANVRTMARQQEDAEVSNILLQVSQALSACLEEDALWPLLARATTEVLEVPWSVVCRLVENGGHCTVAGSHGLPDGVSVGFAQTRIGLADSPVLKNLLSCREVTEWDGGTVPEFVVGQAWEPGAWLAIPLFRGSWVAGVLAAGTFDRRRGFTSRQRRLAEGLGHHASIALQNARMVADLEAADQLKSEFVSTMSHELRTPLNVIIGYTEMLREGAVGPVSPGQLELVNRLDARGRELLELIEATLHVGRLEAGRDAVELTPIELCDLVKALQASTAGLPRQPNVGFEWEVREDAHVRVMTDRSKLSLVIRNLVSNAFKFTSTGKVVVRMTVEGDALVIEVRDTGIGIGAEHLPIIFDMFRQVDGSMTRRHDGVGLGLYIVKQFVGRLGGTVDVRSTPGEGSTFRLVLPGAVREDGRSAAFRAA